MTPSKPLWWRPWSDEPSWQAQARQTATALYKETFLTWLDGAGVETATLSFHDVWSRSAFVAEWLLGDVGLAPGDRAMLVYAPGPEFFVAFVACLRAGILAVPNYPPDPANLGRGLEKLDLVTTACGAEHTFLGSRMGDDAVARLHDLAEPSARVVAVSWLPQFHDSGLMLMLFGPFVAGKHQCYHMINFSPLSFLADPLMWLRAVSKYRALWTASPDFGYRMCTKRADVDEISDINLSSLVYCVGGVGQRCVPSLLREFAAYFAIHCKLPDDGDRGIFAPSYGLAEHVVATCGENGGLISSRRRPDLISCGSEFIVDVLIVDVVTKRPVPDGSPGEVWLSSDSVAQGYWGKPGLSDETFRARLEPDDGKEYLRTGDEAFMEQGHLFICGRIKDLIIIGGENYYSDDVELAATEAMTNAARPGCIAAFALVNADDETESLCIVLEIREHVHAVEHGNLASTLTTRVAKSREATAPGDSRSAIG
ncbi:hypothetical protein CTAYLR_003966 [Chrysophaeum taylorii]|uniref:AMP-dependent synthetase/ligase domain-containing protein n=1 Tax=Chrysophaeum taylorii TaxID=2483200 RepID=A0AAD7XPD9_9STRA|nr:hypothetical protein CTAYLR_003966 [Chrysophaeum taylorii]